MNKVCDINTLLWKMKMTSIAAIYNKYAAAAGIKERLFGVGGLPDKRERDYYRKNYATEDLAFFDHPDGYTIRIGHHNLLEFPFIDDIAQYCILHDEAFSNDEIRAVLNSDKPDGVDTSKREEIIKIIDHMKLDEQVRVWNIVNSAWGNVLHNIYEINDMDALIETMSAHLFACRIHYGDFDPEADYFVVDEKMNIKSVTCGNAREYIDFDLVAGFCIKDNNDFGNKAIRVILDTERMEDGL